MHVREAMTNKVIVVKPRDSVVHARMLLERHRINQLPVMVDGKLVGIITDRDLRDAFPSVLHIPGRLGGGKIHREPENVDVETVMTRNVLILAPDDTLLEAARLMRRERIGALPVLAADQLVGILTRSDVLDTYATIASRLALMHPSSPAKPPQHAGDEVRKSR
jgi:acetoin utilization protein AcuB